MRGFIPRVPAAMLCLTAACGGGAPSEGAGAVAAEELQDEFVVEVWDLPGLEAGGREFIGERPPDEAILLGRFSIVEAYVTYARDGTAAMGVRVDDPVHFARCVVAAGRSRC